MFVVFLSLVVLAYLLPFTVLSQVQRFSGSFLFWNIFAILAILILLRIMRSWHE